MPKLFSKTNPILEEWAQVYIALGGATPLRELREILGVGFPDFVVALQRGGAGPGVLTRFEEEMSAETGSAIEEGPWADLLAKAAAWKRQEETPASIFHVIFPRPRDALPV